MQRSRSQNSEKSTQLFLHGAPLTLIEDNVANVEYARRVAAKSKAEACDDAFFICDVGQLLHKYSEWRKSLPRVHPYYAVKCNNNSVLLSTLAGLGCNFDCASKGELDQIMAMGIPPARIIFANPCKTASHIRYAASCGVRMMTFDNDQELYKVQRLHPEAEMVLRIAVSDPTAVCQLNMKFGCEPVNGAPALLKLAATLGVKVVGISFHVGSGARDPAAFGIGIEHARNLFNIGKELGHPMDIVDLGGGYPGHHNPDISFQQITTAINKALAIHFPPGYDAHIIGEPGRFFAASPFLLCTSVIAKTRIAANKISGQEADADKNAYMYYTNDGVYGSFNCILFDHVTPVGKPLDEQSVADKETTWCSVWGPTCDSMDCIYKAYRLPELNVGDWLLFENMGAYTMAAASEFNGFQKPNVHYIAHMKDWEMISQFVSVQRVANAGNTLDVGFGNGFMSDDSGVPTTSSDDDTCSIASDTCSMSSSGPLADVEVGEVLDVE
jgi:ornithine decarboxylase